MDERKAAALEASIAHADDEFVIRLTPQEFAGFLEGTFLRYLNRGGVEDLKRGREYQDLLIDLLEERGYDTVYPQPMFWTDESGTTTDIDELVSEQAFGEVFAIHSSIEPHVRWGVKIGIADDEGNLDGEEVEWFKSKLYAEKYAASLKEPESPKAQATRSEEDDGTA